MNESKDTGAIWFKFNGLHLEIGSTAGDEDGNDEHYTMSWPFKDCTMLYTTKRGQQRMAKRFLLSHPYGVSSCFVLVVDVVCMYGVPIYDAKLLHVFAATHNAAE